MPPAAFGLRPATRCLCDVLLLRGVNVYMVWIDQDVQSGLGAHSGDRDATEAPVGS
jgi:hypothetical protein